MHKKMKSPLILTIVFALLFLSAIVYLQWYNSQESQSTLDAHPITLLANGSGIESSSIIDKSQIENAALLTDKDFSEYPALRELFTGERSTFRSFSKMRGVSPDDEAIIRMKYSVSEYNGTYYRILVMRH